MTIDFLDSRSALVIAHPGHELRVHQWLQLARPLCFVITDGSGHTSQSRLDSTTQLLNGIGARAGSIYGRFTDHEIYSSIINHDFRIFLDLTEELAQSCLSEGIDYVVGDALEGYNPTHDICRFMINAAVEKTNYQRSRPIENYEVTLTATRDSVTDQADEVSIHLDQDSLTRKLDAARAYSALRSEVDRVLEVEGISGIQTERLRPVRNYSTLEVNDRVPQYESFGEKQVAAGYYKQVLRFREHVLPIAEVLQQWAKLEPETVNS